MTTAKLPGCITVLDTLTLAASVFGRGDVVELTPEVVAACTDTEGRTFLVLADDEREQVRIWGRRMFLPGDHGDAIREADRKAQETRGALADADGAVAALKMEYAREDDARAAAKRKRNDSRTTSAV